MWPKLSLFAPPLRVAVVGAGAIGGEFALRHFGRLTGTSVVGVVDCNEAAARSLASSVGCPSFTSLREALEACDPELIYIGTPPSTHRELVEASLAASWPCSDVWCPLAWCPLDSAIPMASSPSLAVLKERPAPALCSVQHLHHWSERLGHPDPEAQNSFLSTLNTKWYC